METTEPQVTGLSKNQRNLYRYYLGHMKSKPNTPCYVPKNPMTAMTNQDGLTKLGAYIRVIESLENKNLFTVDRTADNYTGWILNPPKQIQ